MAFIKNKNDLRGILTLVLFTLPSIDANIDCNGKAFHCVNSTHFMICVDLGSGVSSTIDDFVIPCPPTTICQGINRFECEFPAVPTTTTTIMPSAAPQLTSASETIETETTTFYDMTTSIPFEEYFNTLSTTTLSEDVLLTQQAIFTGSIIVTDVTDKTDEIIPGSESSSTFSETFPRETTNFNTNVSDTVTESILTGVIETTPTISVKLNLKTLSTPSTTALPDNMAFIATESTVTGVTENIHPIQTKFNLTLNESFSSGNILTNDSTTPNTSSISPMANNEEAGSINVVKPELNTTRTPAIIDVIQNDSTSTYGNVTAKINIIKPEPNTTMNKIYASIDAVPNYLTSLNASSSTDKNTESFVTDVRENVNVLKPESSTILSETLASVHFVILDPTSLDASSSTAIDTETVTNVTKNLNVLKTTLSETPASVDIITHDTTSLYTSTSTASNIEAVTNVTENGNIFEPESNTTLNETSESVVVLPNYPSSLDALRSTAIDTEAVTNVTDKINTIEPVFNTTWSETPAIVDNITHNLNLISLNASTSTATKIEAVTNEKENENVLEPEPNTTLNETPESVVVVPNDPTPLNALRSTAIDTESVTNVTENRNAIEPVPNIILSETPASVDIITYNPTSLNASTSTATDIEAVTNVTENVNFLEPNTTLKNSESIVVVPNDPTSLKASSSVAINSVSNNTMQNDFTTPYTPRSTASSNNTEPVTNNILLINTTVNEIDKVIKTENYGTVTDTNILRKVLSPSADTTSTIYQGSSTMSYEINIVEATPSYILEATIPTQEVDSVTYSNVYYYTDIENISNGQGDLTNKTDGKPIQSENVLSIGTIENTASTPSFVIKDNAIIFTDFLVSVTDAPLEHPASEVTPNSNIDRIIMNTYLTTTIKKPVTDIPVAKPPEVTSSPVTDAKGFTSILETTVVKDNVLLTTNLENNSSKKSIQANNENGSELPIYSTLSEYVSITESPKETYFITAKPLTTVSIISADRKSTAINNNKVITNKSQDSLTISSIDTSSAGDNNIPVVIESVDGFPNTEQTTLATIFTVTETNQDFESEPSSVSTSEVSEVGQVSDPMSQNSFKEVATIATTSTTTDSSNSFLSSSTSIGQNLIKVVKNNNLTAAFITERDTDHFYNTTPATEIRPITIIKEAMLTVNTDSSTASSVPELIPTFTETIITKTANNSYVEPSLYVKSVETTFMTETDTEYFYNTRPATENRSATINEKTTPTVNTVSSTASSVPEFKPKTTEIITTEAANNSYVESPLYLKKSVETTIRSLSNLLTEVMPSLEKPEIKTGANVIGEVLGVHFTVNQTSITTNLRNTAQKASSTVAQEIVANTPEIPTVSLKSTPITNSLDEKSAGSLTDSYSSINEGTYTVIAADENIMSNAAVTANINLEATKENNPLVSLLLNSGTVPTPYREYTIPSERKPIQEETSINVNLSEKTISKTSTQTITLEKQAFVGSTQQETYTEPNIINKSYGKTNEVSTPTLNMTDLQMITTMQVTTAKVTPQNKHIEISGQADQSAVDHLARFPTLHGLSTDTQISDAVQQQQATTANYDNESTSHNYQNTISQYGSTPLHNLDIKPTKGQIITQDNILIKTSKIQIQIPKNPDTTRNFASMNTITTENALLTTINRKAETNVFSEFDSQLFVKISMQSQDSKLVDSLIDHTVTQGGSTSSHTDLAKNFSPTSIQNTETLSHLEQITESWRETIVTNPPIQMKSLIIDEQPLVTKSATETGNKLSQIGGMNVQNNGPYLKAVLSNKTNPGKNVPRDISPSTIAAEPLVVVTSTIRPVSELSSKISQGVYTEKPFITNTTSNIIAQQPQIVTTTRANTVLWNKIPKSSEISVLTVNLPTLDPKAEPDNVPKNIVGGQTTVVSKSKTEFINVPNIVIGQTTDQVITQTSLDLNSDVDIVMMDVIKPINIPVLGEPTGGGTHSGISVLIKPPRKIPVKEIKKIEASESIEKSVDKEGEEKSESIESEQNIMTPAIINSDNINYKIDQYYTPKTVDSKLQFTTNKIIFNSTIEMTTKKMEEESDQSISNIEQFPSPLKPSTKKYTLDAHVLVHNHSENAIKTKPIIVTAYIAGNITSNIRNSTARYTPQTKSPFTNEQNESVPTSESATNSRNFVCKANSRGKFSDKKDCRKFYICLGKTEPIEGICPNNTVFSELRKQCTKNLSHCVRNSQFQCVSEGRFSDYLNDSFYYICVKNNVGKFIRFKLQCQSGYHLNKTSVRCALNTESSQSTSQQSTSDISKDSNLSVSSKSAKMVKEPSKNKKFECKKEGKFPEANDCIKYYICTKIGKSQYQQKSKMCDSGELFHKDKKKCVDAESYECT